MTHLFTWSSYFVTMCESGNETCYCAVVVASNCLSEGFDRWQKIYITQIMHYFVNCYRKLRTLVAFCKKKRATVLLLIGDKIICITQIVHYFVNCYRKRRSIVASPGRNSLELYVIVSIENVQHWRFDWCIIHQGRITCLYVSKLCHH